MSPSSPAPATPHPGGAQHAAAHVRLRMRLMRDGLVAIGPGKVALLEAIRDHGSISAAARHLGMSYRRAWLLLDELNGALMTPATTSGPGGRQGGGSALTAVGETIVQAYRSAEHAALQACSVQLAQLQSLIRP